MDGDGPPNGSPAKSLSEYIARRPRRPGAPSSIALVFDQFEEILTLDPLAVDAKREFFRQLGEALGNTGVWALFALREDYLGALDPYRDDVPTRLGNTFRIDLLAVEAAEEAIVQPANDAGREFAPDAAAQLAKDLATVSVQQPDGSFGNEMGIYVEPLQLQVVCRRLWDELPPGTQTIGVAHLQESGDVDAALTAYYDACVRRDRPLRRPHRARPPRVVQQQAHHRRRDPRPGSAGAGGERGSRRRLDRPPRRNAPRARRGTGRKDLVRARPRPPPRHPRAGLEHRLVRATPPPHAAAGGPVGAEQGTAGRPCFCAVRNSTTPRRGRGPAPHPSAPSRATCSTAPSCDDRQNAGDAGL